MMGVLMFCGTNLERKDVFVGAMSKNFCKIFTDPACCALGASR